MAIYKSRRDFLKKDIFTQAFRFAREVADSYEEKEADYFDSFEKCYPLLSEAGEMLMEEALRQGIQVEGKSRLEIAREIFSTQREKGGD
jgi:hypothetical protein